MIPKVTATLLLIVAAILSAARQKYNDGRPAATLRMDAKDQGIVLSYGDGPGKCDMLGARDVWVFEDDNTYYMHYDAAGPKGWLCSLAVSKDLMVWVKKGPILNFGKPGEDDSKSASYGVTHYHNSQPGPEILMAHGLLIQIPWYRLKSKSKTRLCTMKRAMRHGFCLPIISESTMTSTQMPFGYIGVNI